MKKFQLVLTASKSENILAVIENLPVDANGYFLSEEQMSNIEASLQEGNTAVASLATVQAKKDKWKTRATENKAALTAKEGQLATATARIAAFEAIEGGGGAQPGAVAVDPAKLSSTGWDKYLSETDVEAKRLKAIANS